MKKCGRVLFLVLFLCACSTNPISSITTPTSTYLPMATSTPTSLPTPTPIPLTWAGVLPEVQSLSDLQRNPLTTALQNAINAAGFGVVAGENVSVKTGQSCISVVPEKLWSDTLPNNEQKLKDSIVTDGVAKYDDTQVLAQVNLPADTEDAIFSCALGYAVDNPDYKDGTLRQLLIKTNKADGSQEVIGSMQAGFSTEDNVEIVNGAVVVNGETQGWTAQVGMELPTEQSDFRVGPESMVEGQYNQLTEKNLQQELDQLLPMFEKYMQEKGITADKVASFGTEGGLFQSAAFPYAIADLFIPTDTILGYSNLTFNDGSEMLVMHVPIRRADSSEIVILNVGVEKALSFWEQRIISGIGSQNSYNLNSDPSVQFKLLAEEADSNPLTEVNVYVNTPNEYGSQWLDEFPQTQYLFENNIPDNYDDDVRKSGRLLNAYLLSNGVAELTLATWVNTLEHQILPSYKIHSTVQRN